MNSKFLKINDFFILIEEGQLNKTNEYRFQPPTEVIGLVYYLSGEVLINIKLNNQIQTFRKRKGMMSSFYSHHDNTIIQNSDNTTELKKISIFLSREKLHGLIENDEKLLKNDKIQKLVSPQDYFVSGNSGNINPIIQNSLEQIINNQFTGISKELFFEGQIIGLLANYISQFETENIKKELPNIDKLHHAKEILLEQMDTPPSLQELSKLTGLNTFKLKTGFKELFGVPVFKFLQEKRLDKAYELIENKKMNIQEVAWYVGYESLGSFSNAFKKKFGIRPTEIK